MKKLLYIGLLLCSITATAQTFNTDACCDHFSCQDLIECAEEINNLVEHPCTKQVYYWEFQTGVREQIWSGAGNAATHDDPANIFNGAPDGTSYGTPSHVNGAPDIDITTPSWNNNTANDPSNGTDQKRCIGYFYAPQNATVIGDNNNNNGERFRILLGDCCSAPRVIYESPPGDNSPFVGGTGNAIGNFYTVDQGWHLLIVEGSDLSAFLGFNLTLNGANYSGPSALEKPTLVCKTVDCSYELLEGEMDCPPTNCQPTAIVGAVGEQGPPGADGATGPAGPTGPTGANGTNGSNGQDGQDWQCNPAFVNITAPVSTISGPASKLAGQVLETDRFRVLSTTCAPKDVHQFQIRDRISTSTADGWVILGVPNIAGYDRRIFDVGTYRQNGDINVVGGAAGAPDTAMPDAPFMAAEAHEWSNSGRIYVGQFREKDNPSTSWWIEYIVEYRQN